MSIQLRCECGQRVRAKDEQAGRRFPCPRCGVILLVPGSPVMPDGSDRARPQQSPPDPPRAPTLLTNEQLAESDSGYPTSTGIGRLMIVAMAAFAGVVLVAFFVALMFPALRIVVFVLILALSIVLSASAFKLLLAKRYVLTRKELDLFFGLAKLVAWDPTEAVLILKNKLVSYVDDNLYDGGGIKLIYPVLGEELACRAPLEIQTLDFSDQNVLTREYVPLTVQGTMKWRIVSLQRFYLLVSKEIHATSDQRTGNRLPSPAAHSVSQNPTHAVWDTADATRKLASAEQWLRYMAEEQTRAVVSRINTGLLVADRVAADLPTEIREKVDDNAVNSMPLTPSSTAKYRSATDGLAGAIHESITPRVKEFGIDVHEVTLQEVGLPPHIHDAAVEACKAAYLPLIAQKQAVGRKIQLQAEADVLGAETIGAREVVGSAPAYVLGDFISTFLVNNRALIEAEQRQRGTKAIGTKGPHD